MRNLSRRSQEQFHDDPATYQARVEAGVPHYVALQDAAIDAIPFAPSAVLELGVGAGETARRLLARYPDATHVGFDSSPGMVEQARASGLDVRLASMEGPLPEGRWDLVISVLAVHHLADSAKRNLFNRVRQAARSFVLGDVVLVEPQTVALEPEVDLPASAQDQADWCGGAIQWAIGDFAVISVDYRGGTASRRR